MVAASETTAISLPELPVKHDEFIQYVAAHPQKPMAELLHPFKQYDTEMRRVFAQASGHPAAATPNIVPVFDGNQTEVKIRARNLEAESRKERECYIMPLATHARKPNGSTAIVQSLKDFRHNFNVFSESALADLDWSNVVVAGSAVVTSLLAVPEKHAGSKRALREYYHENLAPASDVDLFLYGLTEKQATQKIKQIEQNIRDAILVETTTVRTKNAITIASQYPTRHVQIVLRIYKSVSEILTGFDVDCSCAAYDGKQVYASPRALAAFMTQINTVDLTRRSPSYESRLAKYAQRGFEVYFPSIDRSRIDPTIFERSFGRTEGLARLLILEKLPNSADRDAYLDQRRAERGRPAISRWRMSRRQLRGNIKDEHQTEVAEWVDAEDVSSYHTFTIPYGPNFHARKIEKLLYTKDLLLNAEWNKPKDREVHLHRHPAFFGRTEDVFYDCCGSCPQPKTIEEEEVAEEESKIYISGNIKFIQDDPGRQSIGSFNPLSADDWTEMAYVGNTFLLCKAIVEEDLEYVQSWLEQDGNDPNTRDYTGRTPLHLAVTSSTPEVVQCLIDHGSRLVARLVDGRTALHLAATRGSVAIVSALLRKSEANEEEEQEKLDRSRTARSAARRETSSLDEALRDTHISQEHNLRIPEHEDSDIDMIDSEAEEEDELDRTTEHSIVNIKSPPQDAGDTALEGDKDAEGEPDVYDVNVVAWDTAVSPLHLAIVKGHVDVVKLLVSEFGADVLLPIKLFNEHDKSARAAILTLVLALQLPLEKAKEMVHALIQLGASCAQADMDQNTAIQFCISARPDMLETLIQTDQTGAGRALNHLSMSGYMYTPTVSSPLLTAITARDSLAALLLLTNGVKPTIDFSDYIKAYERKYELGTNSEHNSQNFEKNVDQPVIVAVHCELPDMVEALIQQHNIDVNTLAASGWSNIHDHYSRGYTVGRSLLDEVNAKISELKGWKPQERVVHAPIPLEDDATYLSGFKPGSYAWWSAQRKLQSAKEKYAHDLKTYETHLEETRQTDQLSKKKQTAIDVMISRFEGVRTALTEKGAKSFYELHPDIEKPQERQSYHSHRFVPEKPKPFKVQHDFMVGNLTDESRARYLELFEAAWTADLAKIKEMTLLPWKNSEGKDQPPLTVAAQDPFGLSPFSISVLSGELSLATAIMEIAKAQYVPKKEDDNARFGLADNDGSDSSEADNKVQIYSEIIDEQFTTETVGEVSTQVKSRTRPENMISWPCSVSDFIDPVPSSASHISQGFTYFGPRKAHTMTGKRTNTGSLKALSDHLSKEKRAALGKPGTLIQYALHKDDHELLLYLLSLGNDLVKSGTEKADEDTASFFTVADTDYNEAILVDRPHLLAEIIKRTGAGLPLDQLVQKSGIEIKEKPRYYQGLSVYGKKRTDWADAGRGHTRHYAVENYRPGLLEAARAQSLETVEWFLGDAPMRCYKEFAETNKSDKRIKSLSQVDGGFEASVSRFLAARSELALHCCILGRPMPESTKLLRYLIQAMPEAIDAKSQQGMTPLQIAFWHYREDAAKILIEAGADQTIRDKTGKNLLHSLLNRAFQSKRKLQMFPRMIDMIDSRVLPSLFFERCWDAPGSLTPLAQWITNQESGQEHAEDVLRMVLKHSQGKELDLVNGEGHTPLHRAVHDKDYGFAKIMLEHDPTLLYRENATGRTPFEMVQDSSIAAVCSDPPPLPGDWRYGCRFRRGRFVQSQWSDGLVSRDPETFLEDAEQDSRSDLERLSHLFDEVNDKLQAQGIAKRRLVTLNEANEVARRLATNKPTPGHSTGYQAAGSEDQHESTSDQVDEVQLWLHQTRSYLEDDEVPQTSQGRNKRLRRVFGQ